MDKRCEVALNTNRIYRYFVHSDFVSLWLSDKIIQFPCGKFLVLNMDAMLWTQNRDLRLLTTF
jgi:hypothetical protein